MQYKKLACVLAAFAALLLSGCASFRNNEIANAGTLPDVSRYATKPSVFVDSHFYRGETPNGGTEVAAMKDRINEKIGRTLGETALFSKYSFDEKDRSGADYVIRLDIYNHGNQGLAAVAGFISGFTFGVIPAAATDNYTLEAKLQNRAGTVIGTSTNKDSITTWIGIWFLPMAASTPDKAFSETLDNQLKAVLKELVDGGKLRYSELQRLSARLLVG